MIRIENSVANRPHCGGWDVSCPGAARARAWPIRSRND